MENGENNYTALLNLPQLRKYVNFQKDEVIQYSEKNKHQRMYDSAYDHVFF